MRIRLMGLFAVLLMACGDATPAVAPPSTLDASVSANESDATDGDDTAAIPTTATPTSIPTTAAPASPDAAEEQEDDAVAANSSPRPESGSGTDVVADGSFSFSTPSGNITCSMAEDTFCHISEKEWEIERPAGCQDDYGNVVFVDGSGPSFGCYTDLFWDPDADPLEYGSTATVGDMKCAIERTGVVCENGDGRGFTIARAAVELF